jgi:hypothetical protein
MALTISSIGLYANGDSSIVPSVTEVEYMPLAAPQRADGSHLRFLSPAQDLLAAVQLGQIKIGRPAVNAPSYVEPAGNVGFDRIIQFGKIDFVSRKLHGEHTASDVHADDIRANLIVHDHGRADHASLPVMYVRHDPHI